jgi:cyclophilin family peptidyl-prolyl cis-trans isomerase
MPSFRTNFRRWTLALGYLLMVSSAEAQGGRAGRGAPTTGLTPADSQLVARILRAENRRDSTDTALTLGAAHSQSRVRVVALRARERIHDATFARRDSLPGAALPAPRVWPEPSWKARFRLLSEKRDDCTVLRAGLADSIVPVQLRAAALVRGSCATDAEIRATLTRWVDALPADARSHRRGAASWHLGAHGVVALARIAPDLAAPRVTRLRSHQQWQVRQYAARAAAILKDRATLRMLATDADANVAEAAIEGLATVAGHAEDATYLQVIPRTEAQAVRAAALALKGTTNPSARAAAFAAFERFAARGNASERDVRIALLEAAGRSASDDRPPLRPDSLDPHAVALALGATRHLEVQIHPDHGGGRFVVRLRGDVAPIMAARILALASRGYYDGSSWHRAEYDFVLQGGSPGANEYVGESRALIDEVGTVPHLRGTVGMSTRGHDTGDAQWFINLRDNARLAKDYTIFAEVTEGMEVVDALLEGDRILRIREWSPTARGRRP